MKVTVRHRDPQGALFAPDSWHSQVGKTVPFKLDSEHIGAATLLAATVVDGGRAVELTLEMPEQPPG